VWVVSDVEPALPAATPAYDRDVITGMINLIEQSELGWQQLAHDLGLEPIHVVYEELTDPTKYASVLGGLLERLGFSAPLLSAPPPRTIRQAYSINDEWTERYVSGF
jgi:LPS sulfotransferase NodH